MKNTNKMVLVLLVGLALLSFAVTAAAQTSKAKGLDRRDLRSYTGTKVVIDRGMLKQGSRGQWLLDDVPLVFTEDSKASRKGSGTGYVALAEGEQALVLGSRRNGSLVVTRVLMLGSENLISRGVYAGEKTGNQPQLAPAGAPR